MSRRIILPTLDVTDEHGDPLAVEVYDEPDWNDGSVGRCDESGDIIVDGPAYPTTQPVRPGAVRHVQPVPLRIDPQAVSLAEAHVAGLAFARQHRHPAPAAFAVRVAAAVAAARGAN